MRSRYDVSMNKEFVLQHLANIEQRLQAAQREIDIFRRLLEAPQSTTTETLPETPSEKRLRQGG
jgi:hypothetical protein